MRTKWQIGAWVLCTTSDQERGVDRTRRLSRSKPMTQTTLITGRRQDAHLFARGLKSSLTVLQSKKAAVVFATVMLVLNSTMGSALPSMAVPYIAKDFGVTSQEQMVLPISVFLIGYVFGPIIWGPLSEHFGRRNLSIATFTLFTVFTMACALAPNWPAFLIFRFFCGALASAPIAVVAGILADIFLHPRERGRAFAIFMVVRFPSPVRPMFPHGSTVKGSSRLGSSHPLLV